MRSVTRFTVLVGGWLVAALLGSELLPSLSLSATPPAPVAVPPPVDPVPPTDPATCADDPGAGGDAAVAERTRLVLRVAELEGELAARERRLAAASAEAERYRTGLERAVAELNRQSRAARGPALRVASRSPARPRRTSPSSPSGASHAQPLAADAQLTVLGDEILVHGTLRNPGRESRAGTLRVELLHDGRVVAVETRFLEIEPRGVADFRQRFRYLLFAGTLSARAVLDS